MRRVGLALLAGLCMVAQVSLVPALRPLGAVPSVVLGLVVLVALEATASEALLLAVVSGLILDVSSGANFGLWTGILMLEAIMAGLLQRAGVELGGPLVPLLMVAVGTVVVTMVLLFSLATVVVHWDVGLILRRLVAELVLNLSLTLALRPLVRRLVPQVGPGLTVG